MGKLDVLEVLLACPSWWTFRKLLTFSGCFQSLQRNDFVLQKSVLALCIRNGDVVFHPQKWKCYLIQTFLRIKRNWKSVGHVFHLRVLLSLTSPGFPNRKQTPEEGLQIHSRIKGIFLIFFLSKKVQLTNAFFLPEERELIEASERKECSDETHMSEGRFISSSCVEEEVCHPAQPRSTCLVSLRHITFISFTKSHCKW